MINLPYLSPALLAKQAATLDVLSGGRHDLGLGTGWSEPEFAATGSDPNPRGRRTEEYLAVLRTLWTDEVAAFEGELYPVPPSTDGAPPVQPAAAGAARRHRRRRAAPGRPDRRGLGEQQPGLAGRVARGAQIVRRAAEEAGRDPDQVADRGARAWSGPASGTTTMPLSGDWAQIRGGAQLYAEAGVTELFYDLNWDPLIGGPDADPAAAAERAEEILTALAPTANPY